MKRPILKNEINSVYLCKEGEIKIQLENNGIEYYFLNKLSRMGLKKAIEKIQPDIIHAHDFTAGILAASLINRIPIINHLHNNSPWLKKISINSLIYALSTLRFKKILTVSESVMDEFIFSNICNKKVEVIDNPIDIKNITSKIQSEDIEPYDIAVLGRLSKQKNPLFFLDILFELKKTIPNVKACMIGDGELRKAVEAKIIYLDLQDNVKLIGFQSNPYIFLNKAKILCMPSLWEGLPVCAIEAQANGLFCLISDNVSKEAKLTDLVEYMPLNEGAAVWAERIIQHLGDQRRGATEEQLEKMRSFDSRFVAKQLQDFYLSI